MLNFIVALAEKGKKNICRPHLKLTFHQHTLEYTYANYETYSEIIQSGNSPLNKKYISGVSLYDETFNYIRSIFEKRNHKTCGI